MADDDLERLADELDDVIALLGDLRIQTELLSQKLDALDGRFARATSDLASRLDKLEANVTTTVTETVSKGAFDVAAASISWVGVLVAVVIGGLIVRACSS
jgi:hypothetical protein